MAKPLRELGQYTIGDVLVANLDHNSVRVFSAFSTIILSELYVVAQLVGAGEPFFRLCFDINYEVAVAIVVTLIMVYVVFGGMLATTWVQIVKAALLIIGVLLLSVLSIAKAGGVSELFVMAEAAYGSSLNEFGGAGMDIFSSVSLASALVFGMLGMPHLLIRFLTVPDVEAANRSVVISALLISIVLGLLLVVVGPAGLAFVKGEAAFQTSSGDILGGSNMILLHLSQSLGGDLLCWCDCSSNFFDYFWLLLLV